ncbi:zinc-binding dehydrogenase [Paraliobacillus zengyii]|uniref:zinc-binding dehydrogenase n=1 Tax=Paraliobacillus zengyii TaxID=2213194 RepID=UPI000DD308E7|nr:zinc-binding dehydrogenase [Paraliobacillus zengyii]
MKAYIHQEDKLLVGTIDEPEPTQGQVKVKLKVAGLNHRDLQIPNRRGTNKEPLILGSDGAGIIEAVGQGVTKFSVGDEVVINPGIGWITNSDAPPEGFGIVGMPNHGTFAEKYVVDATYVEKKPSYLTWEEAGVLVLPALTGFRALFTKGKLKASDTIFFPGAGSGVATYNIQFAKAVGARVIVSSRSQEKREKARALGADVVIDTNEDWKNALEGETIDLVIESVGEATFNRSLGVLKKGGRMVTFGATTEDQVTIDIRKFFYGQYQLFGSTMGSREELHDMLVFMEENLIRPVVDRVYDLDDAEDAFTYLRKGKQFGKVGLQIGN